MTRAELERFRELRKRVMKAIEEQLSIDNSCKSYEGTFEIIIEYPNYFEDEDGTKGAEHYCVRLHCYVIGPARHYEWYGKTFGEALTGAEREIDFWLKGDAG